MVKKKGQKSAQSKKKLDLAAAVEAAEQGDEEELSKLNLNADDAFAGSGDRTENGSANDDDETGSGNNEEEGAALMNYNPPEENPSTEDTGKIKLGDNFLVLLLHVTINEHILMCRLFYIVVELNTVPSIY